MNKNPLRVPSILIFLLALFIPCLAAERLHLKNGGFIDTESWWFEDGDLVCEKAGGTIRLPRSQLLRVETKTGARPWPNGGSPPAASTSGEPDSAAVESGRATAPLELFFAAEKAAKKRDHETAAALYLQASQADPDLHAARVGYALTQMALGRDAQALDIILAGLVRAPDNASLLEIQGDLAYRAEKMDSALRSWREAHLLSPSQRLADKIQKAERESHAGRHHSMTYSSSFNVSYEGKVNQGLAAEVLDYLEKSYRALSSRLSHTPGQPITVLLYSQQEFYQATQSPDWVGGLFDGKIRVPMGGLNRLGPSAREILAHELTHALIHSKTRGNCPRWLHEGVAQLMAGTRLQRSAHRSLVRQVRSGQLSLEPPGLSYPMALSVTGYLENRYGFDSLVHLLDRLADGHDIDTALQRVYGDNQAGISRRWAEALTGNTAN